MNQDDRGASTNNGVSAEEFRELDIETIGGQEWGVAEMGHPSPERVFLKERGITVSAAQFVTPGRSFNTSEIAGVRLAETRPKPSRWWAALLIAVAVPMIGTPFGIGALIGAIVILFVSKKSYAPVLITASGEISAFWDRDLRFIQRVVSALSRVQYRNGTQEPSTGAEIRVSCEDGDKLTSIDPGPVCRTPRTVLDSQSDEQNQFQQQEEQRLIEYYSQMPDGQLEAIAADWASLTEIAKGVLQDVLVRRGLDEPIAIPRGNASQN
jgi:hypothetical protein